MTLVTGVDVSSYQNSTFSTNGLAFAIVKATEWTTYVNPEYKAQLAHVRAAGLIVGHYHYARGTDSAAEVAYFAAHADVQPGDIIALDWEASDVTPAARDAWLRGAKARFPHNRVILYCDIDYWTTLDTEHYAADGLWIADYSHPAGHPNIAQTWEFHQYSSAGGMDHNVANFATKAQLAAWARGLIPVPAPVQITTPTEDDEDMSTTSVNGRAGLSWAAGSRHVVQVNYDGAGGNQPRLRVVLVMVTGPWVAPAEWVPANSTGVYEIPANLVAGCRGVILEDAHGAVYDASAV